MNDRIEILQNEPSARNLPPLFCKDNFTKVQAFHEAMPDYRQTPLVSLSSLATKLGVAGICVKDESRRFELNAFKALGAFYAIAQIMKDLKTEGIPVFVTTTDGNHGKAVAWSAQRVGGKAIIFMPKGSKECRVQAIAAIGDTAVHVTDMNYDDTVRYSADFARMHGYHLVQDTGFEGYEEIPNDITLGYTTMVAEAISQMEQLHVVPTHVFMQAGVGSAAGAVLGYLADYYAEKAPKTTIIEADEAACIFESVKLGELVAIGGSPQTIMAGLNCGETNRWIFPLLRDFASSFARCPDWVTVRGMRKLAHPESGDEKVVSGESGAVGLGLLLALCEDIEYFEEKEQMGLDEDSVVLLFSTEGDTDPENYQKIVNEKEV